jgi:ABC-type sugar transport system substrate-binding protein
MNSLPIRRCAAVSAVSLLLAVGCVACGSDDDDAAPAVSSEASSPTTAESSDGAAGLEEAKAIVEQYRQPPEWRGPDQPVDISGLAGQRVVYISVNDAIPVLNFWSTRLKELLAEFGDVDMQVVDAKGSVDTANQGFQQAIATQADAVVIQALPASLFSAQIEQAQAAGIKVITANTGIPGDVSGGQDAEVSFDYALVGRVIGAWMVADSEGEGKGLVISSDDVPASQPQAQGTLSEVERLCPNCDMKLEDVQIPQWESSIPTLMQTTVNSEPDRNYLLALYDGQALPGLGALRTAGVEDVKVGAFNATPGIVEQLTDPSSPLKLDIGGQNEWWAYAAADQIFRVLSGTEPVENYNIGLRIFDETNADLIQGDDEFAWYESPDYLVEFPALWGAS